MRTKSCIVSTCVLALGAGMLGSQLTLPDLARRRIAEGTPTKPVMVERSRELVPASFQAIVSSADLIVHGVVNQAKVYLTEDQEALYTDYLVTPRQVLFQRGTSGSRIAGAINPIIVQQWGGHTVIDGVPVSVEDSDLRPIKNGAEVILILNATKEGKYRIAQEIAGVLSVQSGRVSASGPRGAIREASQLIGLTVAQLQAEVSRIRAGR